MLINTVLAYNKIDCPGKSVLMLLRHLGGCRR
jgi:hypothetical protein